MLKKIQKLNFCCLNNNHSAIALKSSYYHIEIFEFADKIVSFEELYQLKTASIQGNEANNAVSLSDWKGSIEAGLGDGNDSFVAANTISVVHGNAGNDTLTGGHGNDHLDGGEGDDTLTGGNGDDVLIGGLGDDILTGGQGVDSFIIGSNGFDTIKDFNPSQNDSINLSDLFLNKSDLINFEDYLSFEKNTDNTIALKIDYDGSNTEFDKTTIAKLHIQGNVDTVLMQLNQGIGVVL